MTTRRVPLADVAQARSGDKGDLANVALFAPTNDLYETFKREVTPERVKELFGRFVKGRVDRYEVPNVRGEYYARRMRERRRLTAQQTRGGDISRTRAPGR